MWLTFIFHAKYQAKDLCIEFCTLNYTQIGILIRLTHLVC